MAQLRAWLVPMEKDLCASVRPRDGREEPSIHLPGP